MNGTAPTSLRRDGTGDANVDIAIVGAGIVGGVAALAVANVPGLSVTLIGGGAEQSLPASADDIDSRVYAINPGNAEFFRRLGVWDAIDADRRTPIYAMQVFGDQPNARIEFDAQRAGVEALAWIVEDRSLRHALGAAIERSKVTRFRDTQLLRIESDDGGYRLLLADGTALRARLVIGADGADSAVRAHAGIPATDRAYRQTAVVANFRCEHPHGHVARQWFQGGPVLALLPLPDHRVSMVWSTGNAHAMELSALDATGLCTALEKASLGALGSFECITAVRGLPLRRLRSARMIGHRIALIGDAAHVVHPLAGQGANLGLADVRSLAGLLATAAAAGENVDPGARLLLRQFERSRAEPNRLMDGTIHGLHRLFAAEGWPWIGLRNRGLELVDRMPVLKNVLMRPALG